jgi:hypothetical protein
MLKYLRLQIFIITIKFLRFLTSVIGDIYWLMNRFNPLVQHSDLAPVVQAFGALSHLLTFNQKPVRFLLSGDRNSKVQLAKVLLGRQSGTGYDFVSLPEL